MSKMSILIVILSICFGVSSGLCNPEADRKLREALDYAMSGLQEDAKRILIAIVNDSTNGGAIPSARLLLGTICLWSEPEFSCASYHYHRLISEFPETQEAVAARDIMSTISFAYESFIWELKDDMLFYGELQIARKFWTFERPDWKMDWEEIEGCEMAEHYYDLLLGRHTTSERRCVLLFDLFLLKAGYNKNECGYKHAADKAYRQGKNPERVQKKYLVELETLSDSIKTCDIQGSRYVQTQFLLGVLTSDTKFLSSKIKVSKEALKYFDNVAAATAGDPLCANNSETRNESSREGGKRSV